MKNSFIPINTNSINKIMAFFPSSDKQWRKGQRMYGIKPPVETIDVVEELFDKGWSIDGGYEEKSKRSGLVERIMLKFRHNDLRSGSLKGTNEILPTFNMVNNFKGFAPSFNLGTYRMICSNGMWGNVGDTHVFNIKTNEDIQSGIRELNEVSYEKTNELYRFKEIELGLDETEDFARQARDLRYDSATRRLIDYRELLQARRDSDRGNSLWDVFNRVQENTSENGLVAADGVLIKKLGPIENMNYNTKLLDLAGNYYN